MRIKLQDVKEGDVIYEVGHGKNYKLVALEDTRITKTNFCGKEVEQYWCNVRAENGKEFELLITEGAEHYGPKLYDKPEEFFTHY